MKLFQKKQKDERVVAETNRIYKVGYLIFNIGILFDLYLQIAAGQGFAIRSVEWLVLIAANLVCLVMMVRKGMADDDRYAETDVFPKKHYALVSLGVGAAAAALMVGMKMLMNPYWELGAQTLALVLGITFVSMALTTAVGIYALQYLVFRLARMKMLMNPYWELGAQTLALVLGITFVSMALTTAVGIYALQYLVFRLARSRRRKMQDED